MYKFVNHLQKSDEKVQQYFFILISSVFVESDNEALALRWELEK